MRAIDHSRQHDAAPIARVRLGWAVAIAAASLVLAGSVLVRNLPAPTKPGGLQAAHPVAAPAQPPVPVRLANADQLREWLTQLDQPLETEMKLLVQDTKLAVNSLAENFIPSEIRTSLFGNIEH